MCTYRQLRVFASVEIESRRARDSDTIATVGRLRHVLVLQHSAWNRENCQSLVHEVGSGDCTRHCWVRYCRGVLQRRLIQEGLCKQWGPTHHRVHEDDVT